MTSNAMPAKPLRVLILEDMPDDAELLVHQLRQAGFEPECQIVADEAGYVRALDGSFDVILADYSLPQFDARRALQRLMDRELDVPFIIVSGTVGEEAAVAAMKAGASDYLQKDNLARLGAAIERELNASTARLAVRRERKTKEEALVKVAAIVESSDDAIFGVDLDWKILSWNAGAERLFGYLREEAIGQSAGMLYPHDQPEEEAAAYRDRLLSGARIESFETVRIRKDGQPVEVSVAVSPIKDATGRVTAFSVIMRGIGDRKGAEQALRASEERYRRIVETAFEGVWMIDAGDKTTFVNRRMAEMLGYTVEEMLGKPALDFMDADSQASFKGNVDRRHQGFQPQHDFRFIRKDGSELWAIVEASPDRSEAGDSVGSLAMVTDVTQRRRAELALRESESRFRSVFESVAVGQFLLSAEGRLLAVNEAFCKMIGYSETELLARGSQGLHHPDWRSLTLLDDRQIGNEQFTQLLNREIDYYHFEKRYQRKDGRVLWVLVSVSSVIGDRGQITYIVDQVQDITPRKEAEQALQEQTSLYEALVNAQSDLGEIIILTDGSRPIYINEAFSRLTGFTTEELMQMDSLFQLVPTDVQDPLPSNLIERLQGERTRTFQTPIVAKNGKRIDIEGTDMRFEAGGRTLVFTLARDVTERKQAQQALEHQTFHDALTGLPNRVLLQDCLVRALASANESSVSLLMIDLDHFKEVNDTFGHHVGDLLLQQVGPRLKALLREGDTVARLGGDEFAVLLPGADQARAAGLGARLLDALDRPFEVEGQLLDVAASIGASTFPKDGHDANVLLSRADIAMFVAKRSRGAVVAYAAEYDHHGANRLALMAELRSAIHDGQLILHYQPLVSLRNGSVERLETLVRWEHPLRGVIPPAAFIPFAEKTRLIRPLTDWVLRTALRQCRAWYEAGHALPVVVNISMRDLVDPELPELITGMLQEFQAEPTWLGLEITEGVIMADPDRAIDTLHRLRKLGIHLAIDDFGTGYSSLAYLHRLPVDEIKIDKSFVMQMTGTSSNIVRAAVDLSHSLRLETVAEGVEDSRAWDLLTALGCDAAQGFFIGRPMRAEAVPGWIASWSSRQQADAGSRREAPAA